MLSWSPYMVYIPPISYPQSFYRYNPTYPATTQTLFFYVHCILFTLLFTFIPHPHSFYPYNTLPIGDNTNPFSMFKVYTVYFLHLFHTLCLFTLIPAPLLGDYTDLFSMFKVYTVYFLHLFLTLSLFTVNPYPHI